MKKILLPLVLLLVGIGSGIGAGIVLKSPEEETVAHVCDDITEQHVAQTTTHVAPAHTPNDETIDREYAEMSNQFLVPIIVDEKIQAMVVLSLSLEVLAGQKDDIFGAEPKLRDSFLDVLFSHANMGGFSGNFTSATNMRILRDELMRSAQSVMGEKISDVLIVDMLRQDV